MTDQRDAEILLDVEIVQVWKIQGQTKQEICTDSLKVVRSGDVVIACFGDKFQYPLVQGVQTFRPQTGYYVAPLPGHLFIGVLFPSDTDAETLDAIDGILAHHTTFKADNLQGFTGDAILPSAYSGRGSQEIVEATTQQRESAASSSAGPPPPEVPTAHKVGGGIEKAGEYVAKGIGKAAKLTGGGIAKGGQFLKSKINKKEQETKVSEKTRDRVRYTRAATGTAVKVSAAVVTGAVAMAQSLARGIAASVSDTDTGKKLGEKKIVQDAKVVGVSTLVAADTIYQELVGAAKVLLDVTAETTADLVEHRYGEEVGQVAHNVGGIAKDVGQTAVNLERIGPKAILKTTAKHTAREVLTDGQTETVQPPIDPSTAMMMATMLPEPQSSSGADKKQY
eukprot:GFYU01000985.1.p1 GENE.GFYU01000985.1~~GFYU01000985.1.p1  ORF type:complete len:394 (+),score=87.63 GFYU01000985.1:36-1217(+)